MICIYHSRDLDGWMSAAIVKLKFPNVKLVGYDYGNDIPDMSFQEVIIVDASLPPAIMIENRNRITWIDHHVSAMKDADKNGYEHIDGIRDSFFAACELTWKYFFPEEKMPEIVRLLGRYDCFGHKGTDEEQKVLEFQYGARQYISNPDEALKYLNDYQREEIAGLPNPVIHGIHKAGISIYKYLCTEAKQIYSRAFSVIFLENIDHTNQVAYKFLCVNQERFNPINFGINYHADNHNGFLCFHYANGKWNFSLYNDNGEVDCSAICKLLGGGGHKGAAGFVTDSPEFVIALTVKRMIELNPLVK